MHDKEIQHCMQREWERQETHIELIASENFVSPDVLAAQGSVLTNKYAEGYPGARYYGGCTHVDEAERLAIQRACQLFGAQFANVQPHSGSQANQAVLLAFLKPGDCILSLRLDMGGHLSHGSPVNIAGKWFSIVSYGLDPTTHRINMEEVRALALQHRPALIIAGASAYPRFVPFGEFRAIADEVGALLLADVAHIAGLIVAGLHPHPFPHAHIVTTTTHKTLRGPRGGLIVSNTEAISKKIDQAIFPGLQGGPLMHVIAAKAVCFYEALQPSFKTYAQAIIDNAQALAKRLHENGFTLISGGTDNHLLLVDLSQKGMSGKEAAARLEEAGIVCNKNGIPNDTRGPRDTSGLRFGTPAATTRGFGTQEFTQIADWVAAILLENRKPEDIAPHVQALCQRFPLPYTKP